MAKITSNKKMIIKLPIIDIQKAYRLEKPVVVVPEAEYRELLEDIEDLRDALNAEKDHLAEGGKLFSEYDKRRRAKK
jgi:hypothetical protein